jgi:hypothetical protein
MKLLAPILFDIDSLLSDEPDAYKREEMLTTLIEELQNRLQQHEPDAFHADREHRILAEIRS